jgi:hypothetical protein
MAQDQSTRINILTVAGLAAVAYAVTTMSHEGLGHGGMCVLGGGHAQGWGAYYFDCDARDRPDWVFRAVAAAGSTVNLILGLLFSGLLSMRLAQPGKSGSWTVFLWLMATINLFDWAGYFIFSGISGLGDWGEGAGAVLHGVINALYVRLAMGAAGIVLYFFMIRIAASSLGRIMGGRQTSSALKICLTAYVTGGLLGLGAGLLNPLGLVIVFMSALASSLGGTFGLLRTPYRIKAEPVEADYALPFDIVWVVLGVATAAGFVLILGPTLKFAFS